MVSRREFFQAAAAAPLSLGREVRVGIVGFDGHTNLITDALPRLPDVKVVAYSSDAPSKQFPSAAHFADAQAMLNGAKLDLLVANTHDGARAQAILAGVERGLPVFSEKPLGRTRAEFERVREAVTRRGTKLGIMLEKRFAPHFIALREVVRSGEIGEVALIQGQKSYRAGSGVGWRNNSETYSGTIPWVGIHMADLMLFTSGRRFTECASFQSRIAFPELGPRENTAAILFRLDNGGTATLTMDYLRPDTSDTHDDDRLRIAGTKGVAEYQRATAVLVISSTSKARRVEEPPAESNFADFVSHVFRGTPTRLPLDDIWRSNEVVFAAKEAANSGRAVKL